MEIPIIWLSGGQRFLLVLQDHQGDDQEANPDNKEVIKEEEEEDNDGEIFSKLLKDPRFLQSILQDIQQKQIKSFPKPQPKIDLKRKGLDCSVTDAPAPPPRRNPEDGQCSYAVCVICGDTVPQGEAITSIPCGHTYCAECFPVSLSEKIKENALKVNCPVSKCETLFGPKAVRRYVPEEVLDRWVSCLTESSVLAEPVRITCPFEFCGKLFVDDERGFLIRACPNCWRVFCMKCRVGWHMGKSCKQYESDQVNLERRRLRRKPAARRGGGGRAVRSWVNLISEID